jgi:hypothetical protein
MDMDAVVEVAVCVALVDSHLLTSMTAMTPNMTASARAMMVPYFFMLGLL